MSDTQLFGIKEDGTTVPLGPISGTRGMAQREIAENYFGPFSHNHEDGNDADTCLWAMQEYHIWLLAHGWSGPEFVMLPQNG